MYFIIIQTNKKVVKMHGCICDGISPWNLKKKNDSTVNSNGRSSAIFERVKENLFLFLCTNTNTKRNKKATKSTYTHN